MLNKLKFIFGELLVIVLFLTSINNFIGNVDLTIQADGIGYYDYLPATFIYHDLNRLHKEEDTLATLRVSAMKGTYVPTQNGAWVNKYAVGTAVLQLPFFMYAYLNDDAKEDGVKGYQLPFQKSVFYAALFYLFLALIFLKLLLQLYEIKPWAIWLSQLWIALATGLTHYTNFEASFSHVYSLFAITAFLFFTRKFFLQKAHASFIWASVFFGLILLLRPVNVLILAAVPFVAGSYDTFKDGLSYLFKRFALLFWGVIIVGVFVAFMSLIWYIQCGEFFLNTYQSEEGFYFLNPQILNILFSYKKGLFIYTPILVLAFVGLFVWVRNVRYFEVITWLSFFALLTYILSAWWSWFYGCSYGLRAYIEFFPIFFIPIAALVQTEKKILRMAVVLFGFACLYLNLVQTYQYKEYILHWIDMDKSSYWKVFGKTERKYKGLLWKRSYNLDEYKMIEKLPLFSSNNLSDTLQIPTKQILLFSTVSLVEIKLSSNFKEESEMRVYLKIKDRNSGKYYYEYHVPLIHFLSLNGVYGQSQMGSYFFEIPLAPKDSDCQLEVFLSQLNEVDSVSNFELKCYQRK